MKNRKIKKMDGRVLIINILFIMAGIGFMFSTGCSSSSQDRAKGKGLSGTISISGAFALYPVAVRWAEEFRKIHPDVRIDISAGGAGKGMADVLSEMVDMGMLSRDVNSEEKKLGAWWIAVTRDAVLPTVNSANPVISNLKKQGLTRQGMTDIFVTGKIKAWNHCVKTNEKFNINVYTRSDACGAAEVWGNYLGVNQENLLGVGVYGDPGMADAVRKDPLSLGFNNVVYVYDMKSRKKYEGMDVVPVDINENGQIDSSENIYETLDDIINAIGAGVYPSPPARDLYFVSKGKPDKEVVREWLAWILTEGQKYVHEAGYVALSEEKMKNELQKLNQ